MTLSNFSLLFALCLCASLINAQSSCENYGFTNASSSQCSCPPGFGGATCSQAACGGDIFQGSQRPLAPLSGSPSVANITGCSCESGWTGNGCNVCQTAGACQSAFAASVNASSQSSMGGPVQDGQNDTMTCNTSPRVYAASHMSCQVINPSLQGIYPLSSTLNILRTSQPSLTPLPNITAFGSSNSVLAQLFYAGVEQFYCQANNCTQDLQADGPGSSSWNCQNLQCTCRPGTTFCGGFPAGNLTTVINALDGTLVITCDAQNATTGASQCAFKQTTLQTLFGASGLTLTSCSFGECVRQNVIDGNGNGTSAGSASGGGGSSLSGGVIAGLAVVGGLILLALVLLGFGFLSQRKARRAASGIGMLEKHGGANIEWTNVSYVVPGESRSILLRRRRRAAKGDESGFNDDKVVLNGTSGRVEPGQMMAILGPSGAGKTTLVEILAGKLKSGYTTGTVAFPTSSTVSPHIGFVPQQDILPPTLTVREALLFAARLRLDESIPLSAKLSLVDDVMEKLGIAALADVRIGWSAESGGGGGRGRGLSGGEMRRVSIGLELVARPDILILDEPTSGLDSVSAAKVANVLHALAHDPENPTAVIASIHQPSSRLYQTFDLILLLSQGRTVYSGPGSLKPVEELQDVVPEYQEGYNVADWLLEVASDPPVSLFRAGARSSHSQDGEKEIVEVEPSALQSGREQRPKTSRMKNLTALRGSRYTAMFLTQLQVLCGREWKILRRDKTLFFTHFAVAAVLGVFCGGLYFKTGLTIAGFQSRVGCLFFLGALIAFSSLSALYNVVEMRPLFLRERSSSYYSPTAWLLSRFLFDVIPLRIIPTIVVSSITYWMAGLAHDAAHFFKFLFILVLYTLAMTLFNFLLATLFRNGGIAILLSALSALYQMTFAGFFVHLNSIPPVLRWLQWLCPLKYTLEALAVNEVGSGLMIEDTLQGVPVDVSASLIMNLLFGFGSNNYYRDVLVLFAFIAGFAVAVIAVVWVNVRERR